MQEKTKFGTLAASLAEIASGIHQRNPNILSEAASSMEEVYESGTISRTSESLVLTLAGLAFDIIGETERAKRPYKKLLKSGVPLTFERINSSEAFWGFFTQSIAYFGLRDIKHLKESTRKAIKVLGELQHNTINISSQEGFLLASMVLELILSYINNAVEKNEISRLKEKTIMAAEMFNNVDSSSLSYMIGSLFTSAIEAATSRNIHNFSLGDAINKALTKRGVLEFWPPQAEAVRLGALTGKNLVYSTPAGTGKSFLAYATAADSTQSSKTVYLVPTKTLAEESYTMVKTLNYSDYQGVAISTRDRTEFDDYLGVCSVIVATYEKFRALLKRAKLSPATISRVIIDEVHTLTDEKRGIPLELTITKLKALSGLEDPQIIALSAMLRDRDADDFANWIGGSLVKSEWKPLATDEQIVSPTKIIHRNGPEEENTIHMKPTKSFILKRVDITKKLVLDALKENGQCMVVLESRKGVEDLAEKIRDYFVEQSVQLEYMFANERRRTFEVLREHVLRAEPVLVPTARKLVNLLQHGIAFHHAGVPSRFRQLIEEGVRKGQVKVVVTTTTFEAGLNLPISHVIFPFPKGRNNNLEMKISTYRNLVGRAGRPGFDRFGYSKIVAVTPDEVEYCRSRFFDSDVEPLSSAFSSLMKRRPLARSEVQSEILDISSMSTIYIGEYLDFAKNTWFWKISSERERAKLEEYFLTELSKLQQYGFISRTKDGGFRSTSKGRAANHLLLTPLSIANLLDKLRKVLSYDGTDDEFDRLVLGLVAIPFEISGNDRLLRKVTLSQETAFLDNVITQDYRISELYQRIEKVRQYSTILKYWIDEVPIEDVLLKCGLDPSSDSALLEELLPPDAYWVLSTIAEMSAEIVDMKDGKRLRIHDLAEFCKFGASNSQVIDLLKKKYAHLGRESAIKLTQFLKNNGKQVSELRVEDLYSLFPENRSGARALFAEIAHEGSLD